MNGQITEIEHEPLNPGFHGSHLIVSPNPVIPRSSFHPALYPFICLSRYLSPASTAPLPHALAQLLHLPPSTTTTTPTPPGLRRQQQQLSDSIQAPQLDGYMEGWML
ncbi:hypothetical protein INR49_028572 [Caranx melampygus]|nr:hypothetical protein INR49_028572 [Caranx melampygus]